MRNKIMVTPRDGALTVRHSTNDTGLPPSSVMDADLMGLDDYPEPARRFGVK